MDTVKIISTTYFKNIFFQFISFFYIYNLYKAESLESDINNNTLLSRCYLGKKSVIRYNQKSTYSMHGKIESNDDPTLFYFSRRNGRKQ